MQTKKGYWLFTTTVESQVKNITAGTGIYYCFVTSVR